jgi:hypothetical protein
VAKEYDDTPRESRQQWTSLDEGKGKIKKQPPHHLHGHPVSRFQGTVARSEHQCYLFRTSTKHFHKIEEGVHKTRGVNCPGLETKLRLKSQRYVVTA